MGNRDTRIGGGEVGTEVYAVVNDLQRTVKNALLAQGEGTGILIDLPTVDTSFTPIFETDGDDVYVTLAFFIPGFTDELTVFTLDSTLVTNEATYNSKRKKYTIADISDADRAAQRIERRLEIRLKPERLHHIPMLRAWDGDSVHANPEDGFDYSGYPGNVLFSFTAAGVQFDPANLTGINLVFDNTDPYSAKHTKVTGLFTQPATVVSLKWAKLERKIFGASDTTYAVVTEPNKVSLRDDEFHSVGAKTVVLRESLKTKPGTNYTFRLTISGLGLSQVTYTEDLLTGADPEVANDTAAPSGLDTPTLDWTAEGRLKVTGLQASTNINTLKQKYLVLYNGSSIYYNFLTNAVAASESAARLPIGLTGHVPLLSAKLKKLRNVFGVASPTNVYAYWYAENNIGTSAKSADSVAVDLTALYDHQGDRDTIRGLDVESTLTSPGNILGNGDWMLVDGSDQQYNWASWDGLTTPLPAVGGTGYKVITSISNEIAYVASSHSGWMKANTTWQLLQNVKQRFLPGEVYNITMFLRADTAITVTIKLHLYNLQRPALTGTMNLTSTTTCVGTGTLALTEMAVGDQIVVSGQKRTIATITNNTNWTVTSAFSAASGAMNVIIDNINNTINQSLNLTTSNQYFGAVFSMKQSANKASTAGGTDYARHQFAIEFTSNTDDIYLDKKMCVRGEQPVLYAPRGDEADSLSGSTISPTYIAAPDVIRISGIDGGWKLPDTGGFIGINPL